MGLMRAPEGMGGKTEELRACNRKQTTPGNPEKTRGNRGQTQGAATARPEGRRG